MRKRVLGLVLSTVLVGCTPSGSPSPTLSASLADVLTYKANNARTGVFPGPGPAKAPASIWRFESASLFRTHPLVVDGNVVAGAEDGTLFVLDAASGAPRTLKVEGGFRATGAIDDGSLYVGGLNGRLSTIELSDLKAGWAVEGVDEESIVSLTDDLVIAGAPDDLVACARADGKERWRVGVSGSERMALANGVIYAGGLESGALAAVGLDGVKRWQFDSGADNLRTPLVAGDTVMLATFGEEGEPGNVTALDLDGGEVWTAEFDGRVGSHAFDGARVYVAIQEDPSSLFALDPATGETLWEHDFAGLTVSVIAIAGDLLYIVSQNEGLVALEVATGDVAWQVELGDVARAGLRDHRRSRVRHDRGLRRPRPGSRLPLSRAARVAPTFRQMLGW